MNLRRCSLAVFGLAAAAFLLRIPAVFGWGVEAPAPTPDGAVPVTPQTWTVPAMPLPPATNGPAIALSQAGVIQTFVGHESGVLDVVFSANGKRLFSSSADKTIRVWDVATGKQISVCEGHTDLVSRIAVTPDGSTIVSGSHDTTARLWDANTGKQLQVFQGHEKHVHAVAINPINKVVLTASCDFSMRLWEPKTGKQLRMADAGTVYALSYAADGKSYTFGFGTTANGGVGVVKTINAETGATIFEDRDFTGPIYALQFSADGTKLVAQTDSGETRLVDIKTKQVLAQFSTTMLLDRKIAITPDGSRILSVESGELVIHDGAGTLVARFSAGEMIHGFALSPDGKTVAVGTGGNWADNETFKPGRSHNIYLVSLKALEQAIPTSRSLFAKLVAVDDSHLATVTRDGLVTTWDLAQRRKSGEMKFPGPCALVAASGDRTTLVGASDKKDIYVMAMADGKVRPTMANPEDVRALAVSLDGQMIYTNGGGAEIIAWNAATGERAYLLNAENAKQICGLAISADGKRLIAAYRDKIRQWDLTTRLVTVTCAYDPRHVGGEWGPILMPAGLTGNFIPIDVGSQKRLLANLLGRYIGLYDVTRNTFTGWTEERSNDVSNAVPLSDGSRAWAIGGAPSLLTLVGGTFTNLGDSILLISQHESLGGICLSADESTLYTAHNRGLIGWHDVRFMGHVSSLEDIYYMPAKGVLSMDRKSMLTFGPDDVALLWNSTTGRIVQRFAGPGETARAGHMTVITSAALSADSSRLVTITHEPRARLWNAGTGKLLKTFEGFNGGSVAATISGDNKLIAVAGGPDITPEPRSVMQVSTGMQTIELHPNPVASGSGVRILNADTGEEIAAIDQPSTAWNLSFSNNGHYLLIDPASDVVVTGTCALRVWDVQAKKEQFSLTGLALTTGSATLVGNNQLLVTSIGDAVKLVNLETGADIWSHTREELPALHAAVSPDRAWALFVCTDHTIRLVDLQTGKPAGQWSTSSRGAEQIAFTPDNRAMFIQNNQTLRIHDPVARKDIAQREIRVLFAAAPVLLPDNTLAAMGYYDGHMTILPMAGPKLGGQEALPSTAPASMPAKPPAPATRAGVPQPATRPGAIRP